MNNSVRFFVESTCRELSAGYANGHVVVDVDGEFYPLRLRTMEGLGYITHRALYALLGSRLLTLTDEQLDDLYMFGHTLCSGNVRAVESHVVHLYDAVETIVRTLVRYFIYLRLVNMTHRMQVRCILSIDK